jgi:NAD(P)-dependent dehydrogenase (short-subunit alcohol dehydrogenase family)
MKVKDSVFIITGGASGLGLGTARMFAADGAKIVIGDLNAEAGESIAKELECKFVRLDVADESSARATIVAVEESFGALHGLVNCAGIAPAERVLGKHGPHRLETFQKVVSVNLIGTFNMIRLAAELMAKNAAGEDGERGVIINTASVAAYDGQIGQAGYSASKGGVVGMTLPIARELARSGIRVMTIAPGIFETPMMQGFSQEVQDSLAKSIPFPQRLGRPAEYAALAKHICENVMLNGEVIRLDGAIRMAPK